MTALDLPLGGPAWPPDVAELIRQVNESNEAVEDQCLRAPQATDTAASSQQVASSAEAAARGAKLAYETIGRAPASARAVAPAGCSRFGHGSAGRSGLYFAAQALDGSQDATLVWAGLFLAVLAGGEVALDFYRDRQPRAWRAVVTLLALFVATLGVLRFWYLATIGAVGGLIPAVAGAGLFTAATAGFLFLGYRALRIAETPQAWGDRRAALAGPAGGPAARRPQRGMQRNGIA